MRCPKCGYFSFDYLTECGKCGVGLSDVKEKLGLLGIKPNVPFLLRSLLKDGGGAAEAADDWGGPVPAPAVESNLAEIEFGEDFDLDLGPPTGGPPQLPKAPAGKSSDFALFDLGVPELEEETRADRPAGRGALPDLDATATLSDGPIAAPRIVSPGGTGGGTGTSKAPPVDEPSEGLMFDLSVEDFEDHPDTTRSQALDTGLPPSPGGIGPRDGAEELPGEPLAMSDDEIPHDLVIELDDEDVEPRVQGTGAGTAAKASDRDVFAAEKEVDAPLELSLEHEEDYPAPGRSETRAVTPASGGEALWQSERRTPAQAVPPLAAEDEFILELDEEPASAKADTVGFRPFYPGAVAGREEPPPLPMDKTGGAATGSETETAAPADDMIIELSDDDLEILLNELEGISDKETTRPAGESAIPSGKKN